jgi:hypothetical protein
VKQNSVKQSSINALKSLKSTFQAAYNLVPALIISAIFLTFGVVTVIIKFGLYMAFSLLIMILVSIIVYLKTRDYGEAALSLVVGMLTVFTVNWNTTKLIILASSWVGFSLISVVISSINIASKSESLYIYNASFMSYYSKHTSDELYDLLQEEAKKANISTFGPIEIAEIIQILVYKKVKLEDIKEALEKINILTNIIQVPSDQTTNFYVDFCEMFDIPIGNVSDTFLDYIYNTFRDVPVSPKEFIDYFNKSKRIVFMNSVDSYEYIDSLKKGIDLKMNLKDINEFIKNDIN